MGKFFKIAARKEIKKIRANELSPMAINKIVRNNKIMVHERFIKNVGKGSTNIADLVMHPKHGFSIRKRMHYPIPIKTIVQSPDFKIMKSLKKIQGKEKSALGFAKIYEVDTRTGLSFEEFKRGETVRALNYGKKRKTINFLDGRNRDLAMRMFRHRQDKDLTVLYKIEKELTNVSSVFNKVMDKTNMPIVLNSAQKKAINLLKKDFPKLHDYDAPRNVIQSSTGQRTIIDISGSNKRIKSFDRGNEFSQFIVRKLPKIRTTVKILKKFR